MKSQNTGPVFRALVFMVFLSGACQGMLLPLLSMLLEERGLDAALNGLNASALYLGILAAAPFMEGALYRFGFKPLLVTGALAMAIILPVFPFTTHYLAWFSLRFAIGIFNHLFHYAAVVWIGASAPDQKRGRHISYYGFAFGIGFAAGPLLSELRQVSVFLPFFLTAATSLASMAAVACLDLKQNFAPQREPGHERLESRVANLLRLAWFTLLPPLGYGMLESVISGSLPVYLTRQALAGDFISLVLTIFFSAGLVTQLPIGRLSDRLGRKKTLVALYILGIAGFWGAACTTSGTLASLAWYGLAGGALGSSYSLGVAYMTDCTPAGLLPTGNMLCSVAFGAGSLAGPFAGGLFIDYLPKTNFAWLLAVCFCLILAGVAAGRPKEADKVPRVWTPDL